MSAETGLGNSSEQSSGNTRQCLPRQDRRSRTLTITTGIWHKSLPACPCINHHRGELFLSHCSSWVGPSPHPWTDEAQTRHHATYWSSSCIPTRRIPDEANRQSCYVKNRFPKVGSPSQTFSGTHARGASPESSFPRELLSSPASPARRVAILLKKPCIQGGFHQSSRTVVCSVLLLCSAHYFSCLFLSLPLLSRFHWGDHLLFFCSSSSFLFGASLSLSLIPSLSHSLPPSLPPFMLHPCTHESINPYPLHLSLVQPLHAGCFSDQKRADGDASMNAILHPAPIRNLT